MQKLKQYSFQDFYKEGGFSQSFTLPSDCKKIIGVFILPLFQRDLDIPANLGNKGFLMGKLSILLNNKTDNIVHDYPVMCLPDVNLKMSNGDNYSYETNHIDIQTLIDQGSIITIIFKDSGLIHGAYIALYNPGIEVYVMYEDIKGDWSNNEFNKTLNKFLNTTK